MNKLLMVCCAAALIYGENVFSNTYRDNEKELAKLQESSKGNDVRDFGTENQWQAFFESQGEPQLHKNNDVKDFGTKDQWQAFFESQGEPQRRYFVSPEKAEASRKRRREKIDFLIKQLESLESPDDIVLLTNRLKKLKIESEDATGKLIDTDDEEELHHPKKAKSSDASQNDGRFDDEKGEDFVIKPIRVLRNSSKKAEESLKPDILQGQRTKLKHSRVRTEPNATQGAFAR
ncbi:MAG: hypothetical protein J5821_01425 [Alphaproteobacteria bacterium]|nr:hypothetical protein [Alphaproteobacteria bacterium]